jgi:hypothetical protein
VAPADLAVDLASADVADQADHLMAQAAKMLLERIEAAIRPRKKALHATMITDPDSLSPFLSAINLQAMKRSR